MEQKEKCIKARLVAVEEDGAYTKYVFENLSVTRDSDELFIMLTRCPNWHGKEPNVMQEGFVTYKYVRAGEDTYWDLREGTFKAYNYTAMYFIDFVPVTYVLKDGYVNLKYSLKVK